jgi:hypothetical protein
VGVVDELAVVPLPRRKTTTTGFDALLNIFKEASTHAVPVGVKRTENCRLAPAEREKGTLVLSSANAAFVVYICETFTVWLPVFFRVTVNVLLWPRVTVLYQSAAWSAVRVPLEVWAQPGATARRIPRLKHTMRQCNIWGEDGMPKVFQNFLPGHRSEKDMLLTR